MAAARKFAMVNDQTGEVREVTITEADATRAEGFRIQDASGYNAARAEFEAGPREQLEAAQREMDTAVESQDTQVYEDAVLTAQRTYPGVKGEAQVKEDEVATDQEPETPPAEPGSPRARAEGEDVTLSGVAGRTRERRGK